MPKLNAQKQLDEALAYIKSSAKYIYTVLAIFVIGGILGYVFRENLTFIDELLKQIVASTRGLNGTELIFFILQNNLISAFLAIVAGIFLGIFPLFSSLTNGVVLGYVLGRSVEIAGIGIWWRLLPHGIFELPAIFISFGLGVKLGFSAFSKDVKKTFMKRLYQTANTFLMIVIPLLIIAAAIEGIFIFLS